MIPRLCQRDKRWAEYPLGGLTVGRIGCTITCLSMLTDYFGHFYDPGQLSVKLKFTSAGKIIWGSMKDVLPFMLENRLFSRNVYEINASLQHPKKAVILNVDSESHWVLAIGKGFIKNTWRTIDPWTGKVRVVKLWEISGSAHFIES